MYPGFFWAELYKCFLGPRVWTPKLVYWSLKWPGYVIVQVETWEKPASCFFLTKFRENRVTFMDDIGKMYFSEHHISCLLQFLWWKERNILDKPSVCSCVWRCFIWSLQQLQSENDVSWEQGQISWRACSNFARQLLCGWPVKVSWNWRQGSSVIKGYKNVPWRRFHFTNNKKIVLQSTQRKTNNQVLRTKIL